MMPMKNSLMEPTEFRMHKYQEDLKILQEKLQQLLIMTMIHSKISQPETIDADLVNPLEECLAIADNCSAKSKGLL